MNVRRKLQEKTGRDEGFTLVELLVVIVILGVLSAVVVFSVSGITDRGSSSACKADVKSVEVATEAYFATKAVYPTNFGELSPAFLKTVPGVATDELPKATSFENNGHTITLGEGGAVSVKPAC